MHKSRYIDIHTHILPGVDDGPVHMEESISMLKMEYEQGVVAIIATPHYMAGRDNIPVDELELIKDRLQEEASKIAPDLKIYLGNELLYSDSIIDDLQAKKALTLAGSRYVLVEFLPAVEYNRLFRAVSDFVNAGYIPIIAHAERYQCLRHKKQLICDLIDAGCYIQMNASSLAGNIFNNPDALYNARLINSGLVHFIGSDCHDTIRRKPDIIKAEKAMKKRCGDDIILRVFADNPAKILDNTYI